MYTHVTIVIIIIWFLQQIVFDRFSPTPFLFFHHMTIICSTHNNCSDLADRICNSDAVAEDGDDVVASVQCIPVARRVAAKSSDLMLLYYILYSVRVNEHNLT